MTAWVECRWQMLIFIMVAVAFGLVLPFTGRWLYDVVREKLLWNVLWTGLTFVGNLVIFIYLLWLVWRVMNVTV